MNWKTNIGRLFLVTALLTMLSCNKEDDPTPNPPTPSPFGTMTDSRDGNQYKTVKIGTQTWMAENLRYLPQVHQQGEYVGAFTEPRYFVYGYDGNNVAAAKQLENYSTLGVLYNWAAIMQGTGESALNPSGVKGVCPNGWHVPSLAEWQQLFDYLIANGYNYDGTLSENKIAKSVASKTLWLNSSVEGAPGNNPSQNNSSGLNIYPSGTNTWPNFKEIGEYAYFWTSNKSSDGYSPGILLSYNAAYFNMYTSNANHVNGKSCRCVKD